MSETLRDLIDRGRKAYENGEADEAAELLLAAIEAGAEDYADVHHMLGVVLHGKGSFAQARAALERAVAINPDYTEALLNLAITYNDLGRYAEAQEVLERIQAEPNAGRLDPFSRGKIANLHAQVADAYRSAGALDEACREYALALELGPDFVDLRLRLSECLAERGAIRDALAQLQLVLDRKPELVELWVRKAILCDKLQEPEQAIAAFREAQQRDPKNPRVRAYQRLLEQ